jgi:hypothetical protein
MHSTDTSSVALRLGGHSSFPADATKLHRFCTISAPKTALFRNRPLSLNKLQPAGVKMVQFYPTNILDREKTRHFGQETGLFAVFSGMERGGG